MNTNDNKCDVSVIASDKNWIEGKAVEQLKATAGLEGMTKVVGMPDLHPGRGNPIGAAFLSNTKIYPYLVGIVTAIYINFVKDNVDHSAIEREKAYQRAQAIVLGNSLTNMYNGNGKCLVIHSSISEAHKEDMMKIIDSFKEGFGGKITEMVVVPINWSRSSGLFTHYEYAEVVKELLAKLHKQLKEDGDPRFNGYGDIFESYPRVSKMRPFMGGFSEQSKYNPKYIQENQKIDPKNIGKPAE